MGGIAAEAPAAIQHLANVKVLPLTYCHYYFKTKQEDENLEMVKRLNDICALGFRI